MDKLEYLATFELMQWRIQHWAAASLIPQIILVKLIGTQPQWIEKYYSLGIYPFISNFSRSLNGWLPFSIGDILYAMLIGWVLMRIIKNRKNIRTNFWGFLRDGVALLAAVYFCFHLLWGFNYYRMPLAEKMEIKEDSNLEDLFNFTDQLIAKSNEVHVSIVKDSTLPVQVPYSPSEIYAMSPNGFTSIATVYPFLSYGTSSLKSSLYSLPISYSGYGGYLNPFTNEAQVNDLVPSFKIPLTACHEMGHQIGYAAENETNFVGYLAARAHPDPYFQYSAYFFALGYCLNTINRKSPEDFKRYLEKVNVGIRKNFQENNDHWAKYENPMEPILKEIYSTFLKVNNQKQGILSYRSVVGLLVAYHKQHPL